MTTPVSYAQEPLFLDGGTLYLTKNGQVLYQREFEVTLSKGQSDHPLGLVPANVALASLDLWPTKEDPRVTVSEITLKSAAAPSEIVGGYQELAARFSAEVEGTFRYRLAFPLNGLTWSVSNACRLSGRDRGALSSALHLTNRAGIGLGDVAVLMPKSSAPAGPGRCSRIGDDGAPGSIWRESQPSIGGPERAVAMLPSDRPMLTASETEMFKLDRLVSIEAGEAKTLPVGRWPGIVSESGYLIETVFSSGRSNPRELVSEGHFWGQVKTTTSHVMNVTPTDEVDPGTIRLFPGPVRLLGLFETSLTYASATRWSLGGRVVSLYIPSGDLQCHRSQTKFDQIHKGHVCEEETRVSLTNKGDKLVNVDVLEPLFRSERFAIVEASIPYVVTDDASLRFLVKLDPKAGKTIVYKVKYELD